MRNLLTLSATALLIAGVPSVALAQVDTDTRMTGGMATDDDDDDFPWGILGLIGLAGLLGRKRDNRNDNLRRD